MTAAVPVQPGLFTITSEAPRLVGGRCTHCKRIHFPRAEICPYCSLEGCVEHAFGERGKLYLYTVVQNRPPGYRGEVPFGFGVVELAEGIRVITRLTEAHLDRLRFNMPMRLVVSPLHEDDEGRQVVSYAFAPDAG
jgi:uncharacterized OB-fold protein